MGYHHFSAEERIKIEIYREEGQSTRTIAQKLGVISVALLVSSIAVQMTTMLTKRTHFVRSGIEMPKVSGQKN